MKKIKLKSLFLGILFTGVSTTIILTSGILSTAALINVAGSSAVQPLMVAFANKYPTSDLVTQAGGSGAGIRSVIEGTKDIGMASKWPKVIESGLKENATELNKSDALSWKEREIKTVTIAWDGMGVVYKPSKADSNIIDINDITINTIYKLFAGHEKFKLSDLGIVGDDTFISPYARSGGATISGTADAFFKDSNLNVLDEVKKDEKIINALINGNYGPNTTTTSESNSQAWSFVKNENKVGSMTYLSAGFINNNIKEIESNGFRVAKYKDVTIDLVNIANGYDWFRPLNIMLPLRKDLVSSDSKALVEWILHDPKAQAITKEEGYVVLKEQEIKDLMTLNDDFWKSDQEIFDWKSESKPKVIE
ncbi:MAG: PstS family phosphate ABC transporter substrate-binding protein [Mycoplasmataceae bacterium]|nr:PstS family phosphate ABC transporter substrate-binding protein [Mycoplasmataceae bacterium]